MEELLMVKIEDRLATVDWKDLQIGLRDGTIKLDIPGEVSREEKLATLANSVLGGGSMIERPTGSGATVLVARESAGFLLSYTPPEGGLPTSYHVPSGSGQKISTRSLADANHNRPGPEEILSMAELAMKTGGMTQHQTWGRRGIGPRSMNKVHFHYFTRAVFLPAMRTQTLRAWKRLFPHFQSIRRRQAC